MPASISSSSSAVLLALDVDSFRKTATPIEVSRVPPDGPLTARDDPRVFPLAEVVERMIGDGEIKDATTIPVFWFAACQNLT